MVKLCLQGCMWVLMNGVYKIGGWRFVIYLRVNVVAVSINN